MSLSGIVCVAECVVLTEVRTRSSTERVKGNSEKRQQERAAARPFNSLLSLFGTSTSSCRIALGRRVKVFQRQSARLGSPHARGAGLRRCDRSSYLQRPSTAEGCRLQYLATQTEQATGSLLFGRRGRDSSAQVGRFGAKVEGVEGDGECNRRVSIARMLAHVRCALFTCASPVRFINLGRDITYKFMD